jgi:hypothetical protein
MESSIAVFQYVPEDEYQPYVNRKVIYYKVTCTLTGYQPQSAEIEGRINWNQVKTKEIKDFEAKLNQFKPCHGAILQVTVAPKPGSEIRPDDYPYFLDFQPKQRALYEQASDTKEQVSRSLEALTVKKGAGTADSLEVLDIDQGFSFGVSAQYAGAGIGVSGSRQGQWGSKRLGQENADNVRTTDSVREIRDTVSHTTQIS